MYRSKYCAGLLVALLLAVGVPLSASTVLQMNLEQMCDRADKIFRGTLLDVREGTVDAGGGKIPTVTYRLRVDESFKGSYQMVKGMQIAEITMVGKLKAGTSSGMRAMPVLPEPPRLSVGRDYLLLTTPASAVGLSTTVGLGQGAFQLSGKPGQELAVNGNHNRGLLNGMGSSATANKTASTSPEGPIPYSDLAQLIRGIVGN